MRATWPLWHTARADTSLSSAAVGRARTLLVDRGGALAIATLVLYVVIAPDHIVNGENADFVATGSLGGIPHPSGYPLYSMWLRAWSVLPLPPAHAFAIATAMLSPLLVLSLHAACRAWGARPAVATAAVAMFVTGPIVLRIHTEVEVFALNGVVTACIVWLAAERGPVTGQRRVAALCLVAGLGLANHLTCVLLAPVGILGVARGIRESTRRGRAIALGAVALVAGLLPYLYLYVAPSTSVSWGEVTSIGDLARHALRFDYGAFQFAAKGEELYPLANAGALASTTLRAYLFVPSALGGIAVGLALLGRQRGDTRAGWWMLVATWVLAGPLLVLRFNMAPEGIDRYVVERFHLQSLTLFAVFVAAGIDRALDYWKGPTPRLVGGALAATAFVVGAALSLPDLSRKHSPAVEQGLRNLLATMPPAAIVIGTPDDLHFGMGYLQSVLGIRLDVTIISTSQLGLPYYRDRLKARTGFVVEKPGPGETVTANIAKQALATGRPVFIDTFQANIAGAFPIYPYGILFRVLPLGSTVPSLDEMFEINRDVFARYRFGYAFPGPNDFHATRWHELYARVWASMSAGLAQAGRAEDAAFARSLALELAPRAE